MNGSKKAREALISHLQSADLARPTVVNKPIKAQESESSGFIQPNFAQGSLLLMDKDGAHFRLSWNESGNHEATSGELVQKEVGPRAIPAGDYTLMGYRLLRFDSAGARWDLSVSGPELRRIKVKQGATIKVAIDPTIHIRHAHNHQSVHVDVVGDDHAGATIYREGSRMPLHFEILNSDGAAECKGRIRYG